VDLGLKDKLIAVTGGAGGGIGEGITRTCLAEGARVVILNRPSPPVAAFVADLQSQGAPVDFIGLQLADAAACADAIAQIGERHGDLFGLVNNAGINDGISLADGTAEQFEQSLRSNLLHYFVLAHHALPALKRTRGAIVNISSKVALTGQGRTSAYAAAKGAQLGLTREWAADLLPFGIRVNAILPAEVMTPAYRKWLSSLPDPDAKLEEIKQTIPLERRMTTSEEIGAAAAFLLSPTQSGHTTGQFLHIDGGYVHLDRALT
jgi:L-fucose dehydrogenase